MKKDAETNPRKMTNTKENHTLTTVHFPVRTESKIKLYSLQSINSVYFAFQAPKRAKARRELLNLIGQESGILDIRGHDLSWFHPQILSIWTGT